jgi:hypothetical protein
MPRAVMITEDAAGEPMSFIQHATRGGYMMHPESRL